ncbi:unnamed protein product [Rhizopus stolonifer]
MHRVLRIKHPLSRALYHHQASNSPFSKLTQGLSAVTTNLLKSPLSKVTQPRLQTLPFTNQATNWSQAVKEAQGLVHTTDQERMLDPAKLVGQDLWELKGNIVKLLGSGHPFLDTIGRHYFESDTFRIRPLLVLLTAQALGEIEPRQRRLAEITEMIYTATLLHNDVLDLPTAGLGNKMAVLAGDFLLARASLVLAQLRSAECTELIATCITNSVEGVFMQLQSDQNQDKLGYYMEQVYMNTASLVAQSCKASSVLANSSNELSRAAYEYGKHLGIAFHCMSDVVQFSKLAANTKRTIPEAWINAPVLIAWKEYPELGPIIERQFSQEGDMEKVN